MAYNNKYNKNLNAALVGKNRLACRDVISITCCIQHTEINRQTGTNVKETLLAKNNKCATKNQFVWKSQWMLIRFNKC